MRSAIFLTAYEPREWHARTSHAARQTLLALRRHGVPLGVAPAGDLQVRFMRPDPLGANVEGHQRTQRLKGEGSVDDFNRRDG